MAEEEMRLQIGDVLQLQAVAEESKRYSAKLLGFYPDKSIITTVPRVNKKPIILRDDQRFVVRVLSEGCVHGFQSSVMKHYNQPYPHMHLSFPKETTSVKIRQAQRVKLDLKAKTLNTSMKDFGSAEISIVDMSTTGAKIKANKQLGLVDNKLEISTKINIADMDEELLIIGIIRNEDMHEDSYFYGIQFEPLERHEVLVVHSFVLEQVANTRT